MARNIDSKKGMASGLFNTEKGAEQAQAVETVSEQEKKAEIFPKVTQETGSVKENTKKVGRPRDGDLQDGEETRATTIQLTDDTIYKLDAYLLNNRPKSRSQVIRELIRNYL